VYKIREDLYLVQTVDFITPVVDDPYTFGRIAAINSLSDIYAMGGKPVTALSVLMYNCDIDEVVISEMMEGAVEELNKAKCTLLGGHTVDDSEIKLGFAVTGYAENNKYYKNCSLREGDLLIYTKPLGIGILTTAIKGELASDNDIRQVTDTMLLSNQKASEILNKYDVSAVTDVTGFGFAGHLYEMAKGSDKSVEIYTENFKFLDSALSFAEMGIIPAGAYFNKQFIANEYEYLYKENREIMFFDPQTSGGLLIGVSFNDAQKMLEELKEIGYEESIIAGLVLDKAEKYIFFK
jgi:selenide,water dikinase